MDKLDALKVAADGRFCGYASLFNRADRQGDVIEKGAFALSLQKRPPGQIRMLFQHDPKEPIGIWHTIKEDGLGLFVVGQLAQGAKRSDDLQSLINLGAVDGLSIGFKTSKAKRVGRRTRLISKIDLWEISVVTFPMMERATIRSNPSQTGHFAQQGRSAMHPHIF